MKSSLNVPRLVRPWKQCKQKLVWSWSRSLQALIHSETKERNVFGTFINKKKQTKSFKRTLVSVVRAAFTAPPTVAQCFLRCFFMIIHLALQRPLQLGFNFLFSSCFSVFIGFRGSDVTPSWRSLIGCANEKKRLMLSLFKVNISTVSTTRSKPGLRQDYTGSKPRLDQV